MGWNIVDLLGTHPHEPAGGLIDGVQVSTGIVVGPRCLDRTARGRERSDHDPLAVISSPGVPRDGCADHSLVPQHPGDGIRECDTDTGYRTAGSPHLDPLGELSHVGSLGEQRPCVAFNLGEGPAGLRCNFLRGGTGTHSRLNLLGAQRFQDSLQPCRRSGMARAQHAQCAPLITYRVWSFNRGTSAGVVEKGAGGRARNGVSVERRTWWAFVVRLNRGD